MLDASLAEGAGEDAQDEEFLEVAALEELMADCYALGTPVRGLCDISGRAAHQRIVMGCSPVGDKACYADYMLADGTWAGAYGSFFDHAVHAADAAGCTTAITETAGRWTIEV